jgi:hypothetical protein
VGSGRTIPDFVKSGVVSGGEFGFAASKEANALKSRKNRAGWLL